MGTDTEFVVGGIWGQTRNLDDRTLDPADLSRRGSGGRGGLGAQIWGQTRYPTYRSGTFNVQRSTFNGVSERAPGGRDMGTDTELRRYL